MDSKTKDLFVKQLAQNPANGLIRVNSPASKRTKELFSANAIADLERRYAAIYDEKDRKEAAERKIGSAAAFSGSKTKRQFEKHTLDRLIVELDFQKLEMEFHVSTGTRMICAPYDDDWSVGSGFGFGGRIDGKVLVFPSGKGYSAAGIGFSLTTAEPVLAEVTPQGAYRWSYSTLDEDLWFSRTAGGLTMQVYEDATFRAESVATLWNQRGLPKFKGDRGSGQIAQARTPSLAPMGTLPLAPLRFNMYPGRNYMVWVSCWEVSHLEKEGEFIGGMSFEMPCVTIHAGPQPNPPH